MIARVVRRQHPLGEAPWVGRAACGVRPLLVVLLVLSSCTGSSPTVEHPSSLAPRPSISPPHPVRTPGITWKPQVSLSFEFDHDVTSSNRAFIRGALRHAVRLFPYPHRRMRTPAGIAVFVHSGNGDMTRPNEIAEVRRQSIHVFVGSEGWRDSGSVQRREAMYHEWVHIVQQLETPIAIGPVWLVEGSAEWSGWDAVIRQGLATASVLRNLDKQVAALVNPSKTLKSMEGQRFYRNDPDGRDYALAYLAVDFLHPRDGWRTIVGFYYRLGIGYPWTSEFRRAFKISVTHFYRSFEADRAKGFAA